MDSFHEHGKGFCNKLSLRQNHPLEATRKCPYSPDIEVKVPQSCHDHDISWQFICRADNLPFTVKQAY